MNDFAWPTFAAPLALGAAQTVELRNVPEGVKQLWIPICTCTSCTGALSDAVFTGDAVHPGYGCHLRLRDGMLGVEICGLGTMVVLR